MLEHGDRLGAVAAAVVHEDDRPRSDLGLDAGENHRRRGLRVVLWVNAPLQDPQASLVGGVDDVLVQVPAGRPVEDRVLARDVADHVRRLEHLVDDLGVRPRRQREDVIHRVVADGVAGVELGFDQLGMALGQVADGAERGRHVLVLEDLQDGRRPSGIGPVVERQGDDLLLQSDTEQGVLLAGLDSARGSLGTGGEVPGAHGDNSS